MEASCVFRRSRSRHCHISTLLALFCVADTFCHLGAEQIWEGLPARLGVHRGGDFDSGAYFAAVILVGLHIEEATPAQIAADRRRCSNGGRLRHMLRRGQ